MYARNALVLYIKKERNTILYLIYYRTEEIVSAGKKRGSCRERALIGGTFLFEISGERRERRSNAPFVVTIRTTMKIKKAIECLNDGNRFVVPMLLLLFIKGKERKIILESFDLLVR